MVQDEKGSKANYVLYVGEDRQAALGNSSLARLPLDRANAQKVR